MVPHARPAPLSLNSGPILLGEVAETARGNQQDHVKYASYLAVVKAQLIMHLAPKSCSAQLLHLSAFFSLGGAAASRLVLAGHIAGETLPPLRHLAQAQHWQSLDGTNLTNLWH